MNRDFGWWKALPRERTLVNKASGQRVRRVGPSKEAGAPAEDGWWRFEYEDEEGVRFPILARTAVVSVPESYPWALEIPHQALVVDYERSAELWQRVTGSDMARPPYGLWRRVDDCLTDALPCWARMGSRDRAVVRVYFVGGWLIGAWRADFRRCYSTVDRKKFRPGSSWLKQHIGWRYCEAERPILLPVDLPAPTPWCFRPFPPEASQAGDAVPEACNNVRLENTRYIDSSRSGSAPTVPPELPLTGFEGQVPYMRSSDGKRVLFPSRGTIGWRERGKPFFSFSYSDDKFGARLSGRNRGACPLASCLFEMGSILGGPRSDSAGNGLERCITKDGRSSVAGYPQWHRLSRALLDAWLFWEGTPCTNSEWSPGLALPGTEWLYMRENYLGGIFPAGDYILAWLAKGRTTNRDFNWQ